MSTTPKITLGLLQILGLSAESAQVICTELDRLNERIGELEHQSRAWDGIRTHVQGHPDAIWGHSVPGTALAWLRDRDALKSQLAHIGQQPDLAFQYPGGFKCCSGCQSLSHCDKHGCTVKSEVKPAPLPPFVRCVQCQNSACGPGTGCAQTNYYR